MIVCGGDENSYTEKEYLEAWFKADCTRYKECKEDSFNKEHSSIADCIQAYKESNDSDEEDEIITYNPVCTGKDVLNPEVAKKYVKCVYEESCQSYVENSVCDKYKDDICFESCANKGEEYCKHDSIIMRCDGEIFQQVEDCSLAGESCIMTLEEKATCYQKNCTINGEMKCEDDLVLTCQNGSWTSFDCAGIGKTCVMNGSAAECSGSGITDNGGSDT